MLLLSGRDGWRRAGRAPGRRWPPRPRRPRRGRGRRPTGAVVSVPAMRPCTVAPREDRVGRPVQAAPVLRADPLAHRERRVDEHHQLGREHADRGRDGPVGRRERDDERPDRHPHRLVEHERRAVERERAEPEQRERPVRVGDRRRLQAAERPRLEHEPGEHRQRQQDVGGEAARAGEQPEGRVVRHPSPPARIVRPSAVTSTRGTSTSPPRKAIFASTSASTAVGATTVTRSEPARGRTAGGGVDQVVALLAAAAPAPPVAAGGGDRAAGQLERDRAVDADRPGAAARRRGRRPR